MHRPMSVKLSSKSSVLPPSLIAIQVAACANFDIEMLAGHHVPSLGNQQHSVIRRSLGECCKEVHSGNVYLEGPTLSLAPTGGLQLLCGLHLHKFCQKGFHETLRGRLVIRLRLSHKH